MTLASKKSRGRDDAQKWYISGSGGRSDLLIAENDEYIYFRIAKAAIFFAAVGRSHWTTKTEGLDRAIDRKITQISLSYVCYFHETSKRSVFFYAVPNGLVLISHKQELG